MKNAKTTIRREQEVLFRSKLVEQMDHRLNRAPILYMEGEVGCGKSTLVMNYLDKYVDLRYSYLLLDEKDNEDDSFIREIMRDASQWEDEGTFLLIFDHVHVLTNVQIRKELLLFLSNLPKNFKVILMSREKLFKDWRELLYKGLLSVFPADQMMFREREVRDFFYMRKENVTTAKAKVIYHLTGGWPGAVAMCSLHQYGYGDDITMEKQFCYFFVKERLWDHLDEKGKKLLFYGGLVPFFNRDFCELVYGFFVEEEDLFELKNAGLLSYDSRENMYRISNLLVSFFEHESISFEEEWDSKRENAASWYENHGYRKEMFEVLKGSDEIEQKLTYYAKHLINEIPLVQLKSYLSSCGENSREDAVVFLQGWVAARELDYSLFDKKLHFIYNRWEKSKGTNKEVRLLEYYMNLLYFDSRVDICQWLQILDELWLYEDKMSLYSFSSGNPVFCCGIKNFAPMFVGKLKEERNFVRIWNAHMDDEACLSLELAKYSYYIQTDRGDKVYEEIQKLYQKVIHTENEELYAGLYYLFISLEKQKQPYSMKNELDELMNRLHIGKVFHAKDNCDVLSTLIDDANGRVGETSRWMLHESPEEQERDIHENAFLLLLKARVYYSMKQYKKGANLCERLADYYEKMNLDQMLAECLFEQAVMLYENNEKNKALMKATKALTVGAKYRYLDLYTYYGGTGVTLIEEYHKLTDLKLSKKKQYYYGNVLRANYEGYQSILLRCAKKAKRSSSLDSKKEDMVLGHLTMTELAILRYIKDGMGNQEIGDLMNIKVTTVKSHIYNIYRKLGVSTRVQAINEGKEQGLIG